jgi:leader peptidase (prepilin peptidase)/N-methyltransferase
MELLIALLVFIFGTIIGSFLNVVIYRMNTGMGVGGRSKCLSCGKFLTWYELIPVFSYLAQKGKCKKCNSTFSAQYPLVEVLTGVVFFAVYQTVLPLLFVAPVAFIVFSFLYLTIWSILIVITVYDKRHGIIPNTLVYTFMGLSLIASILLQGLNVYILVSGLVLFAPFALLWFLSKGKLMGFGDAKLAIGIGFLLGLSYGTAAIILGFWTGAIFAIIYMMVNKKVGMKTAVPFGPFLILGTFLSFVFRINLDTIFSWFIF